NFVVPARLICEIALARVGLLGLQRLHATARRKNFPTLPQQRFLVWGQIHAVVSVFRLRQKIILARYLSPPMRSPSRPSMPPRSRFTSSRSPLYAAWMRSASRENGSVCSHTRPGPVSAAKNKPSPPKRLVLIPPTRTMSYSTVGS